jgi:uncharacterized protein Yka (UPF0111/DUF47 family)
MFAWFKKIKSVYRVGKSVARKIDVDNAKEVLDFLDAPFNLAKKVASFVGLQSQFAIVANKKSEIEFAVRRILSEVEEVDEAVERLISSVEAVRDKFVGASPEIEELLSNVERAVDEVKDLPLAVARLKDAIF